MKVGDRVAWHAYYGPVYAARIVGFCKDGRVTIILPSQTWPNSTLLRHVKAKSLQPFLKCGHDPK